MTQIEYTKLQNRVSISNALNCITGLLVGEEYGVNVDKFKKAYSLLREIETDLLKDSLIEEADDE